MDLKDRKELLDRYTKKVNSSITPDLSEFVSSGALKIRDLNEEAVAKMVLDQTGVSIPNIKNASRSEVESFLNKLLEEQYPELKGNTDLSLRNLKDFGDFNYDTGKIRIAGNKGRDVIQLAADTLHEGGHKKDFILDPKFVSKPIDDITPDKLESLRKIYQQSGTPEEILEGMSKTKPYVTNEIIHKGHHKTLVDRLKSFGASNLENLSKGGKLASKMLPVLGPAIALGTAVGSGKTQAGELSDAVLDSVNPIYSETVGGDKSIEDPNSYEFLKKRAEEGRNKAKDELNLDISSDIQYNNVLKDILKNRER